MSDDTRTRLVAVLSGGDWADASVDHIRVPCELTMDDIQAQWHRWYNSSYLPALRNGNKPIFYSVTTFACTFCGAIPATASDLQTWWE